MNVNPIPEIEQWMLLVSLLDKIRQKNNLSIKKTAEIAEMKPAHVSRFFSCKFEPKISTVLKIAKAVKTNLFFEDQNSQTDYTLAMKNAIEQLGRRADKSPKN